MRADGTLGAADMPEFHGRIAARHTAGIHCVARRWLDVDTLLDLADARACS